MVTVIKLDEQVIGYVIFACTVIAFAAIAVSADTLFHHLSLSLFLYFLFLFSIDYVNTDIITAFFVA